MDVLINPSIFNYHKTTLPYELTFETLYPPQQHISANVLQTKSPEDPIIDIEKRKESS